MDNVSSVSECQGRDGEALGSGLSADSKKRVQLVARPDEEEQTPSIFSCRQPIATIPVASQGPSSRFKLHKTKHKIFLSHAGTEKNFVEQLCVDLEAKDYFFPFFDQRSHSLPKGKDFAPLISEAAEQCHVAVIVLSEQFLTSKWPMIELGKFHEAKKGGNPRLNLLPLFFKLSMEDLDERAINERWMPKWQEYASADKRRSIDVNHWSEAVKALLRVNGYIFEQPEALHRASSGILYRSEVDYRRAVTQAILELSPPDLLYGSAESMVGYDRLCKTLSSQFVQDTRTGVLMLGLYGMPGLGKTTMSKALCDHFHSELVGRVCRVELGDSSSTPLMRQKEVLRKLWGFKNDVLDGVLDVDQGRTLMRDRLKQESMKRQSAVFLVIDNVCGAQHSLDEARAYVEAGFCPKSRIMVTSRGENIVEGLLSDSKFCKPVPDLTEEEAGTIMLQIAAPGRILSALPDEERRILAVCIDKCRFSRDGAFDSDQQYHPLALRALANSFRNEQMNRKSLSVWEKFLNDVDRGSSHDLFDILEMQFKSLNQREQLFFLDIALHGWELRNCLSGITKAEPSDEGWVSWLGGLHMDRPPAWVERVLRQLERSGMIKWPNMTMHQLYKDFAVWFVTKGNSPENEWCVRENASPDGRTTRIRIAESKRDIPRSRVEREWGSLVLLQLHSCTGVKKLNLDGLDCLRHLELVKLKNLETLTLSSENDSLRFVWLWDLDSLGHLPEFKSSCILVRVISITRCLKLSEPPRIEGCSELESLRTDLRFCPQLQRSLAASLSALRKLYLSNPDGCGSSGEGDVLNLEGLGLCSQLTSLSLDNLPVKRVLGLAHVTTRVGKGLQICFLNCPYLEEAPEGLSEAASVALMQSDAWSNWLRVLRDGNEATMRKMKVWEDKAAERGMSVVQPKLHFTWTKALGPSLSPGGSRVFVEEWNRRNWARVLHFLAKT